MRVEEYSRETMRTGGAVGAVDEPHTLLVTNDRRRYHLAICVAQSVTTQDVLHNRALNGTPPIEDSDRIATPINHE